PANFFTSAPVTARCCDRSRVIVVCSVPMDRFPARRLDNSARRVRNPHDGRIFSTAEELVYSTACRAFYSPDRRDFSDGLRVFTERRDSHGNPTTNGQPISVCSTRILAPITISPIPPTAQQCGQVPQSTVPRALARVC